MSCEYLVWKNGERVCVALSNLDEAFIWCEKGSEYKKCRRRIRKNKAKVMT